jgi:hypothetical protein
MTSHNLNSSPELRKGLVTDVPGPMCNGCSGTLIPQEGLVTLLCAERRKMHCSSGGRCGRGTRLLRNSILGLSSALVQLPSCATTIRELGEEKSVTQD